MIKLEKCGQSDCGEVDHMGDIRNAGNISVRRTQSTTERSYNVGCAGVMVAAFTGWGTVESFCTNGDEIVFHKKKMLWPAEK
jgi:hypothetical protein